MKFTATEAQMRLSRPRDDTPSVPSRLLVRARNPASVERNLLILWCAAAVNTLLHVIVPLALSSKLQGGPCATRPRLRIYA